jgi:hypothetical protein
LSCICGYVLDLDDLEVPDEDRLPWKGYHFGVAECLEYRWFAKRVQGVPGWVSCSADDPDASLDINRLYVDAVWDREKKRFVRLNDDPDPQPQE